MNMKTGKNGEASPGRLPIFSKSRRVLPPEPRTGIRTPSLMADQKPLISDSPTNSVTTTGGAATSCLLVVDQDSLPVLLVSRLKADGSELKAAIPVSEYGSDPKRFWQRLERAGIAVHNPATRKLIKRTLEGDLEAGDSVTMAYKSGWANLSTFVMRDGEVIPPAPPTAAVYTFFDTNPNGGFVGTLAGWKAGIEQNLEGQLLLQALTCLPFVTPLLEPYGHLAGIVDNPGLNICGVSSSGKTTGAICMLSVSGKCPDALNSWQMTDIAPETLMRAHGGMSLVLDEAGLSDINGLRQSMRVCQTVMWIAAGVGRSRHQDIASGRTRLLTISTSNLPIAVYGHGHEATNLAVQVRMPNLDLSGRKYGILDTPKGDAGAQISALLQAASEHSGTAIRAYIERLVAAIASEPEQLEASLKADIKRFKEKAGFATLSEAECRVGNTYALAYAAARQAKAWDILPATWVVGPRVRDLFHLVCENLAGGMQANPISRFEGALRKARAEIVEPKMVRRSIESLGEVRADRDGHHYLVVEAKRFKRVFGHIPGVLTALRDIGALVREGGQASRLTIKRSMANSRLPVWVYCIRLDPTAYPKQLVALRQD